MHPGREMTAIGNKKAPDSQNTSQAKSLLTFNNLITRHALLLTILLILTGIAAGWVTAQRTNLSMRKDLLQQLEMVALTINIERIKSLSGSETDLQNPDYLRLKQLLSQVKKADEKIRFLYLMGFEPDVGVFFFVDNEPPESEDYSAPGDLYPEASKELLQAF